jgi:hypothetical protein
MTGTRELADSRRRLVLKESRTLVAGRCRLLLDENALENGDIVKETQSTAKYTDADGRLRRRAPDGVLMQHLQGNEVD